MMFRSLRTRLIATYSLIIILTLFIADVLILDNYFQSRLEEKKITLFTYGNMIANTVARDPSDILRISGNLEQYTLNTGARFLLVSLESKVITDSMHRYNGRSITNPQIRQALGGRESWAVYGDVSKIIQLALPVTSGTKENPSLHGAILISASIDDLYNSYESLRWKIVLISLAAGLLGVSVSFIAGYRLSGPIKRLIGFSRRLSRGYFGETIEIKRKDEIGQLADTINSMSTELHRIETNRRRFIGDVSHELKTPLASIKALVESLLMGRKSPDEYREFLEDVVTEVDRLSSLITSLLTFTRLEEETLNRSYHNISKVIEDTVRVMTPLALSHKVKIINKAWKDINIYCDQNLVREMLVNLIDNSIKYRDKDKRTSYISITDYLSNNSYKIEISDNGIGIPQGDLPRIFEGFYRSDPSRSKEIEGYGMGLAIVKRITELHRWNITADSIPGNGTTITLSIPLDLQNL